MRIGYDTTLLQIHTLCTNNKSMAHTIICIIPVQRIRMRGHQETDASAVLHPPGCRPLNITQYSSIFRELRTINGNPNDKGKSVDPLCISLGKQ